MQLDTTRGREVNPKRRESDNGRSGAIREFYYRWQHVILLVLAAGGMLGVKVMWPRDVVSSLSADVKQNTRVIHDTVLPRLARLEDHLRDDSAGRVVDRRLLCYLVQAHERDGSSTPGTAILAACPVVGR